MSEKKNLLNSLGNIFLIIGVAGIVGATILWIIVPTMWLFSIILGGVLSTFLIAGAVCKIIYAVKKKKKESLTSANKYVYADIVDIDINVYQEVQIDRISMNPYYIVCKYIDETGKEYTFKSRSLLYNPSALLSTNQLKVYVDLKNPSKYYVDTNSILPDDAVLHKFKYDSVHRAETLIQGGQYIEATTCGVELVGRVKVNSMIKPMFLKVTENMANEYRIPVDEKNRTFMGYTVLCKYIAPDGKTHIFASRGIWGEPDREYKGEKVKVYYSGKNFDKYHVALEEMR